MIQHLIAHYRRDRDGIVTIHTSCGLLGERVAGDGDLRLADSSRLAVGRITTCVRCAEKAA